MIKSKKELRAILILLGLFILVIANLLAITVVFALILQYLLLAIFDVHIGFLASWLLWIAFTTIAGWLTLGNAITIKHRFKIK